MDELRLSEVENLYRESWEFFDLTEKDVNYIHLPHCLLNDR